MSTRLYRGQEIDVAFDSQRCIHAAECGRRLQAVFDVAKRPWVQPDNATADQVQAAIDHCPSGALSYMRHDGGLQERAPDVNTVALRENGPLIAHAEIKLVDEAGGAEHFRAALCRCGASANKPYCDGSHSNIAFTATGEPAAVASAPLAERNGPLTITPLADGPLLLNGNVELVDANGDTVNRTRKTALCRCGASANKPYCDGTHAKIGFTTTP